MYCPRWSSSVKLASPANSVAPPSRAKHRNVLRLCSSFSMVISAGQSPRPPRAVIATSCFSLMTSTGTCGKHCSTPKTLPRLPSRESRQQPSVRAERNFSLYVPIAGESSLRWNSRHIAQNWELFASSRHRTHHSRMASLSGGTKPSSGWLGACSKQVDFQALSGGDRQHGGLHPQQDDDERHQRENAIRAVEWVHTGGTSLADLRVHGPCQDCRSTPEEA